MNELLAAATRMCTAIAVHYEKLNGGAVIAAVPAEPTKTRAKKGRAAEKPAAEVPAILAPVATPTPKPNDGVVVALDEKGSEERLKVVGEAFTQRFSKQMDAVDEVKGILEKSYKVARLRDLTHPQRLELIATLEGRMKEIDSKATQSAAAAPAPAGLGL